MKDVFIEASSCSSVIVGMRTVQNKYIQISIKAEYIFEKISNYLHEDAKT